MACTNQSPRAARAERAEAKAGGRLPSFHAAAAAAVRPLCPSHSTPTPTFLPHSHTFFLRATSDGAGGEHKGQNATECSLLCLDPLPLPPCRADLHRVPSNCPSTAGLDTSTPSVGPLAWLFLSVQPPSRQPSTGPLLPYRPFPICKPSRRCWVPCSSLPPSPALPDNGHERVQHIGRRPPPHRPSSSRIDTPGRPFVCMER